MDDGDIADTVIVAKRTDALAVTPSDLLDPDDSDTRLREGKGRLDTVVEPASGPLVDPPSGGQQPRRATSSRESHVATLAPIPPAEQGAARYRYRINHGPAVDLDVVTLIGRGPREPRVRAAEAPALVAVPSPALEVSSTHLELKQYGASIVVTDMRSTNGTRVVMPGADPVVLRSGESVVAVPGTVIDIGDDNLIEILPMRRFVPGTPDTDRLLP